ncbi:hypothetical protein BDFB_012779 [Asbolus verrucosus]|uniref:CCHC-type domain-containing protein n=1 Tax=Asbolus verrucosus TaxID=1661398 RepID=A0A482V166_ASBVE|nr:hypothetical protein BDFB_012779 [Asbolus verrucosus]
MFINTVELVVHQQEWSEQETVRILEMKLKDRAKEYYLALRPHERPKSVADLRTWLKRIFSKTVNKDGKRELANCIRSPDETLGAYVQRIKILANRIFPGDSLTEPERHHRDRMMVAQFLQLANEILRTGDFYNVDDALDVAEKYEVIIGRRMVENPYDNVRAPIRAVNTKRPRPNIRPQSSQRIEKPKSTTTPLLDGKTIKFPAMARRCFRCGEKGHIKAGCCNPQCQICFLCGMMDNHFMRDCSLNSQQASTKPPN